MAHPGGCFLAVEAREQPLRRWVAGVGAAPAAEPVAGVWTEASRQPGTGAAVSGPNVGPVALATVERRRCALSPAGFSL